jgi:hypothetical protein
MRALLLVVATGCWTGSSTTQPTTPTQPARPEPAAGLECAQVVAHAMEVSKDELDKATKPDQIERIRIAAIDSCLSTRWSQELLGCFNAAQRSDDLGSCQTKMTKIQNDDLQKRMIEAIQVDLPQNPCGGNPCGP